MTRTTRNMCLGALICMSALLAACGGGSSSGTTPTQPPASQATLNPTAPPAAANRTVIGHATLSIVAPPVLHAKSGTQALIARSAAASSRQPQFIDPAPNPNPSADPVGNLLDIYVDGTLQVNLDGGSSGSSLVVGPTTTGAQTVTLPIYSTGANLIVAVEYDYSHSYVLAIGETNVPSFSAGATQSIGLTMAMNAKGIGVVDVENQTNTQMLGGSSVGPGYTVPCSDTIAFYPTDALNNLLAQTGAGTGVAPVVTGVSENSGTSSLSLSSFGTYLLNNDGAHDHVDVTAHQTNPAYAIYNDINNVNYPQYSYNQYTYAHFGYYYYSGTTTYQGLWELAYYYRTLNSIVNQINNQMITGYAYLAGGC